MLQLQGGHVYTKEGAENYGMVRQHSHLDISIQSNKFDCAIAWQLESNPRKEGEGWRGGWSHQPTWNDTGPGHRELVAVHANQGTGLDVFLAKAGQTARLLRTGIQLCACMVRQQGEISWTSVVTKILVIG